MEFPKSLYGLFVIRSFLLWCDFFVFTFYLFSGVRKHNNIIIIIVTEIIDVFTHFFKNQKSQWIFCRYALKRVQWF